MSEINVIDLEATCWRGHPPAGQVHEVIEIGVCVLELETLERKHKRSILVKPTRSSVSPFCSELTGISPDAVANGLLFTDALALLLAEYRADSRPWASWGDYDRKQLQKQCAELGLHYPLSSQHHNAKKLFSNSQGLSRRFGMKGALQLAGLPLEGRHHSGADDAWNIATLLGYLLEREVITAGDLATSR